MKKPSNSDVIQTEWRKIAFSAAMVMRMAGNYDLFCELTGAGDSAVLGNILNLVWESVSGQNQRIDFQKQQQKLELITPNPAEFDMYGVWPALDAAVALTSLLNVCERWDQAELDSIVTLSNSTIERYLETAGDECVDTHPLLMSEQASIKQLQTIIREGVSLSRPRVVVSLKTAVSDSGVTNIGLEV